MDLRFLKKTRVVVSAMFLLATALIFLDLTYSLQPSFSKYPLYLQFIPSLLKFITIGSVVSIGFIFVIILTLLFGRVYCSTICPLGILQDIIIYLRKKKKRIKAKYSKPFTKTQNFVFSFSVLTLLLGSVVGLNLLDPYSNFGRILTNILRPIAMGINNSLVFAFESFNLYIINPVQFSGINVFSFLFSLSIFSLIIWLSIKHGRLYCNTICPVGTFLGFLSKISIFKIGIIESNCIKCGVCEVVCKSNCIDSKNEIVDFERCVGCFDCLDVCPSIGISYLPRYKGNVPKQIDTKKRDFLTSIAVFTIGANKLLKAEETIKTYKDSTVPVIRESPVSPPGSLSIRNFTDNCTACHLCIASCPTQVLQPSFLEYGLLGIMQPRMDYINGFCNFECTACTDVCPSGAIIPQKLETKKSIQLGKAKVIKENCVVHTEGTDCGACAEHCPTKAVKMVFDSEINKKAPIVTDDYCIGCGACEFACPTKPFKAIYVVSNEVHAIAQKPVEEKLDQNIDLKEDFPF